MSIVAGIVAGGHTVSEAFAVIDGRQIDDWARIDLDYYQDFSSGLRFGRKEVDDIYGYLHLKTRSNT